MKKVFFTLLNCFCFFSVFAQWSPTGTSLTSNIFRTGSVGVGYTTAPSFGTNKFLVNGNSYFYGNVGIGTTTPSEKVDIIGTLKSTKGIFYNDLVDGTIFLNDNDRFLRSATIMAGPLLNSQTGARTFQFFDFPESNLESSSSIFFSLGNRNYKRRFTFTATTNSSSVLLVHDKNQDIVFRLNDDGMDNIFLDMPKLNSRVVIAGWGDYLPEHKLVVRGSSMIEGNILTDSNVGIGTSNFTDGTDIYRLSVNGAVRANRVRVYTDWADYVFEKDYNLPTLEEVENHIKEKGHLIDIPSASEVEEKGIELGEMNKLLLQKIEELTLYIIQINKELNDIKSNQNR